jgi:hypothetical protein
MKRREQSHIRKLIGLRAPLTQACRGGAPGFKIVAHQPQGDHRGFARGFPFLGARPVVRYAKIFAVSATPFYRIEKTGLGRRSSMALSRDFQSIDPAIKYVTNDTPVISTQAGIQFVPSRLKGCKSN